MRNSNAAAPTARRGLGLKVGSSAFAAAMALLGASGAHATAGITESLSATASWQYSVPGGNPPSNGGGLTKQVNTTQSYSLAGGAGPFQSNVQFHYETVVGTDGSFDFLQAAQCKGNCDMQLLVTITDTVTNTTSSTQNLRFDSQITSGHIGFQGIDLGGSAQFNFTVSQKNGTAPGPATQLYNASALSGTDDLGTITPLNGLTTYVSGHEFAYDWGATNIFVNLLPIAAGQTAKITWRSQVIVNSRGFCDDLGVCEGAEVAFGDPRNSGGVGLLTLADSSTDTFVLDRGFDPTNTFAFVTTTDADKPGDPKPPPIVHYTGGPFSAVPEPATWAMLLAGFGMIGTTVRRRKSLATSAA
jgi:hypothetical protein